jgi:hypothetical protein
MAICKLPQSRRQNCNSHAHLSAEHLAPYGRLLRGYCREVLDRAEPIPARFPHALMNGIFNCTQCLVASSVATRPCATPGLLVAAPAIPPGTAPISVRSSHLPLKIDA